MTRPLVSALLTYDDGTTQLFEVEDGQGTHTVSDYDAGLGRILITHDIFIAYAKDVDATT